MADNPSPASTVVPKKQASYRAGRDYQATDKGLIWWQPNGSGERSLKHLANFNAWLVSVFQIDDGQETVRAVRLEGAYEKKPFSITIPVKEFNAMNWHIEQVDPRATIYANCRERSREAIQALSKKLAEHHLYRHTGWREIDGKHIYLHGDGAISSKGAIPHEVQLSYSLSNYRLPDPRRKKEVVQAVRASMKMLDVAPDRITFPLFAGIWRATLGNASLSLYLSGLSGSQKSQLAALAQQHWGPAMDADHLPGAFASTVNANEGLAFEAKDALFVIDDFVPMGSAADIQRQHRDADRLLRAQGNQAGRSRMNIDTSLRPAKHPRGIILGTGEDVPGGQSLRARIVVVEFSPGDVNLDRLTVCQHDARDGKYALAMAGFLKWLAPRFHKAEAALRKAITDYRKTSQNIGSHRRTPDNMAHLMQGFHFWLSFAVGIKAITPEQRAALWDRACKAFDELVGLQSAQQIATNPPRQFLNLIASALASGRAYLAAPNGGPPHAKRQSYGWSRGADPKGPWLPQGQKIGWIQDELNIYLEPSSSFAVAQSLAKESGEYITLSKATLQRRLKQAGLLMSTDDARQTVTIRRKLEGTQISVLHISQKGVYPTENPTNPTSGTFADSTVFGKVAIEPDKPDIDVGFSKENEQEQGSTSQQLKDLMSGLSGFPRHTPPRKKSRPETAPSPMSGSDSKPDIDVGFVGQNSRKQFMTAAERRAERLRNI